jgi:hypothetical protein
LIALVVILLTLGLNKFAQGGIPLDQIIILSINVDMKIKLVVWII